MRRRRLMVEDAWAPVRFISLPPRARNSCRKRVADAVLRVNSPAARARCNVARRRALGGITRMRRGYRLQAGLKIPRGRYAGFEREALRWLVNANTPAFGTSRNGTA